MLSWLAIIGLIGIAYCIYTMAVNQQFLRCPHCGRLGTWRFRDLEAPVEQRDEEGVVVRSSTRQRCAGCGGDVIQTWSDHEGRTIDRG